MSADPLHVAPRPCNSCPYLRSTPTGIWHPSEYEKLLGYDEHPDELPAIAAFHCHQENATGVPTACRGWLGVHPDSIAVRFAQVAGLIRPADVPLDDDPSLYSSGAEACEAGLAGVEQPSPAGLALMAKLLARRAS